MKHISRNSRTPLALLVTLILPLLLSVACANNTGTPASNTNVPTETGYQIKFFLKGQQVASLGLTELHSLPEVTIEMGGDTPASGPTLLSALERVGIKEFSKVIISGMVKGRIASAELTLQRDEVTNEVVLDFTNQGKTKLCGKQIPQSSWIIDVSEIRAE